jgi:hypothetical protein
MARVDDFFMAREISKKELAGSDPEAIAKFSGADFGGDAANVFSFRFLNRDVAVSWPDMELSYPGLEKEVPIQDQVLLLHYLKGTLNARTGGNTVEWVSFQDVPDGRFYLDAFLKRAKIPLVSTFGSNPKRLIELASDLYNAAPAEFGDSSVTINALPRVPVVLVLWECDDEFPPEGNILFERGISGILPAEDIAWLAGAVVYPLVGMAKGKPGV